MKNATPPRPGAEDRDAADRKALRNRALWTFFKRYWRPFLIGSVFLVATNVLALRIPRELGRAIQLLKEADSGSRSLLAVHGDVVGHAVAIILLAVGAAATRICSRIFVFYAGRDIEYDLRNQVFAHLARLSPRFYQSMPTGDLTSRVINDTTYVRLLFGLGFLHSVNTAVAGALAISLMVGVDASLAAYCLIPYPILLLAVARLATALHAQTRRVQEKLAELTARSQQNLTGMPVIKAYAVESVEEGRFDGLTREYVDENLRLAKIRGVLIPLMMSMAAIGTLFVLYLGGRGVVTGEIQLGQFIEFSGYVALLAWPIVGLGWVISVWQRGTAAFDRIIEILKTEPDIEGPDPEVVDTAVGEGRIEFDRVRFGYEEDEPPVLDGVDLTIEAGSKVGIVGRSGSGKTTLIKLIARFYDVDAGQVRIDGRPIADIPLLRLRSALGLAPQEPFLFSTTIEKNLRFGFDARRRLAGRAVESEDGNGIVERALQRALRASQFEADLDAFPEGLQTMVGERGVTLSGGQKQRLALGRALMTEPKVLVLDDSLSSVDSQTERRIIRELESIMQGRTTIVVTHRFNILELMDEVVVLARGQILERGPHDVLLAKGGAYAEMFERQRLREEISAL